MRILNDVVRRIGSAMLAQAALACALPLTIPAQNLLPNPGFEKPAAGVTPGTTVSYTNFCNGGTSAAASWQTWVNTCGTDISTTLVPSTAPKGGSYMMRVVTTGPVNGIYANFTSSPRRYHRSGCSSTADAWGCAQDSTPRRPIPKR